MRFLLAFLTLGVGVSKHCADEVKVEPKDLPRAVLETVKKRFPRAKITEATKETDGNDVEYEVCIKDGETEIDLYLTPAGKIKQIEKSVPVNALPRAVSDGLKKTYPKATLTHADEIVKVVAEKEVVAHYEVQLTTADKKLLAVEVSPGGKILKTEDKTTEKK
jgi:uncharacterized membrane protein YkoI